MRAVVLSDLHLGAGGGAGPEDAFVSFLEWLITRARSDESPWRLIVLGDLLDLMHPPTELADPFAALDAVADRHRSALAALGAAAASGIQVDLVPGNHDSELLDSDLQEHLRVLVGGAAGVSGERLRQTFHVRPWFVLIPGLLYAEHGSQYHPLNAVADPLAPFGPWSPRLPPGAVIDLGLRGMKEGARARTLARLFPAVLRAAADRRRTDETTVASLQAHARETGLSSEALAVLRNLGEDSPFALARNVYAGLRRRAGYVESRQRHASVAIHRILAREGQPVPLYVFGHTHRVAHRSLPVGDELLLWLNPGAWVDGGHGFVEVENEADGVVARLWRWDAVERSALPISDPLSSPPGVVQEELTTRTLNAGSRSEDPVATP